MKAYKSGQNRYDRFCEQHALPPYPVAEPFLSQFVAQLLLDGLAAGTVKAYLSAIRHAQIGLGLGDPCISNMPQLEYVLKGFRQKQAQGEARPRLPITPAIMRALKTVWAAEQDQGSACMLWAAACLCFIGFLRSGEATVPSDSAFDERYHLTFKDVSIDSRSALSALYVTLKASKTDPYRKGLTLVIGVGKGELCPVAAVLDYMVRRGASTGPLFRFSDGRYLTRSRFVAAVRML